MKVLTIISAFSSITNGTEPPWALCGADEMADELTDSGAESAAHNDPEDEGCSVLFNTLSCVWAWLFL